MQHNIGELMAAVAAQGVEVAGPLFTHHLRMDPQIFDFELGLPVKLVGVGETIDAPKVRNRISRRALGPMLMVLGIIAVAIGAGTFWLTGGRYVTIDDSYVRAAKETLSTDVSGIVAQVPVKEGQLVKKGQVLLRLDPRQFQIALEGATLRPDKEADRELYGRDITNREILTGGDIKAPASAEKLEHALNRESARK